MSDFAKEFIDMLLKLEEFKSEAYLDKAANPPVMTIGYGTTRYADGSPVKKGDVITEAEARKLVPLYLKTRESEYKKHFPNWDLFPEHMKNALRNIAYRGGANNFAKSSPKFTAAINKGMEDGFLNTEEAQAIIKEMELGKDKSVNVTDRKQRNAALLLGLYDYDHNESIGSLGGKNNTKTRTEYTNFGNNVFYPGNNWNKKWEATQNAYKSNADLNKIPKEQRKILGFEDDGKSSEISIFLKLVNALNEAQSKQRMGKTVDNENIAKIMEAEGDLENAEQLRKNTNKGVIQGMLIAAPVGKGSGKQIISQVAPKLTQMATKEIPITVGNVVKGVGLGAFNASWMLPAVADVVQNPLDPFNLIYAIPAVGSKIKKVFPKIKLNGR